MFLKCAATAPLHLPVPFPGTYTVTFSPYTLTVDGDTSYSILMNKSTDASSIQKEVSYDEKSKSNVFNLYCNKKKITIKINNTKLLLLITPHATKQLANTVPNILLIL